MVVDDFIIFVMIIVVSVDSLPVLILMKGCLRLNYDINTVPILLFYNFKDGFD